MHTHLFTFKVIERVPFNVKADMAAYGVQVTSASGAEDYQNR